MFLIFDDHLELADNFVVLGGRRMFKNSEVDFGCYTSRDRDMFEANPTVSYLQL